MVQMGKRTPDLAGKTRARGGNRHCSRHIQRACGMPCAARMATRTTGATFTSRRFATSNVASGSCRITVRARSRALGAAARRARPHSRSGGRWRDRYVTSRRRTDSGSPAETLHAIELQLCRPDKLLISLFLSRSRSMRRHQCRRWRQAGALARNDGVMLRPSFYCTTTSFPPLQVTIAALPRGECHRDIHLAAQQFLRPRIYSTRPPTRATRTISSTIPTTVKDQRRRRTPRGSGLFATIVWSSNRPC